MSELLKDCYVHFESDSVRCLDARSGKRDAVKSSPAAAEAEAEARRIIETARVEAERIKRLALEEAKASIKASKEAGYREGIAEARLEVRRDNKKALDEIKSVAGRLDAEKDRLIDENKKDIIGLAFKIAEKVINQKLTADEGSYLKIFEKAAKDLSAQKWVKLSVSNQSVEFVTQNSEYLLAMVSGAERLEIEVLDGAPAGECVVETSDKIVDAGVQTQLRSLRAAVLKA